MKKVTKPDLRPRHEKTLDELEGVVWGPPSYGSYLVQTCHRLRTKPIGEFGIEDLRIMIGQNIGLPYLLPLAIDRLEQNPWAEGDMYRGDLLKVTATAEFAWEARVDLRERLRTVVERALLEIRTLPRGDDEGQPRRAVSGEPLASLVTALRAVLERFAPPTTPKRRVKTRLAHESE